MTPISWFHFLEIDAKLQTCAVVSVLQDSK